MSGHVRKRVVNVPHGRVEEWGIRETDADT